MDILIRRALPDDYEEVYRVHSMPKVIWGTLQIPFASPEIWRKRLSETPDGVFNLVACVNGEIIGDVSLMTNPNRPRRRHTAQVGMAVHDDWQGKGVGTALMQAAVDLADKWINLYRLELEVFTDNEPAIRLYKRFDFAVEGTHRAYAFRDGQYVDAYSMARLRSPVGF